jgi:hypothetical protein
VFGQLGVETVQRHTGFDGDQTCGCVGGNQLTKPVESHLDPSVRPIAVNE